MSKLDAAEILIQKFALEWNSALAMENAGIERLKSRIEEVTLPEAKQKMQLHFGWPEEKHFTRRQHFFCIKYQRR